jgi:hypothetical protein
MSAEQTDVGFHVWCLRCFRSRSEDTISVSLARSTIRPTKLSSGDKKAEMTFFQGLAGITPPKFTTNE